MTLVVGVLLASLVGSVHCAAMCGAFVCTYAAPSARPHGPTLAPHLAYNAGRLVSYLLLGLLFGALGGRIEAVGAWAGIARTAPVVAGVLMVAWGAASIAASAGVRLPLTLAPEWARRRLGAVLVAVRDQPDTIRAGITGLVTTLLPCGWLYTFAVTAAGTGSAATGALVMLAFWAGTVPMMLGVGLGARRAFGPFVRRLPAVAALVVLVLGVLTISGRVRMPMHAHDGMPMPGMTHDVR